MANNESAEIGDDAGAGENSSDQTLAGSQASGGEQALLGSVGRSLILASVTAVVAWGALEVLLPVFEMPPHLRDLSGNAPAEQQKERMAASVATSHKNATFAFALLAGLLALALTIAELKSRNQIGRSLWGGPVALLIAAGVAVGGGILGGSLATSTSLPEDPLTKTIMLQVITLGFVGLGVGLGLSLAIMLPQIQPQLLGNCVVGGALGGALGGLVFPLASSVLLPSARTEVAMPDPGISRLLWLAVGAILIAATMTGIGQGKKPTS